VSTPPPHPAVDAGYVAARRVLLDALVALQRQSSAVIVAGAQAIYLRTGHGDLAVAPYTTDGDLAIDPSRLDDDPELEDAMRAAGFELSLVDGHIEPGTWITNAAVEGDEVTIPIDLIVPEAAAPPGGRRGARLGVHGRRAARRASGLEVALVDHSPIQITALDPHDTRSVEALVAGEAAMLVAKAYKIHDREQRGRPDRIDDKDAAGVVRLMQTTDPATVGATLSALTGHPVAGPPASNALDFLDELFGRVGRPGIDIATRALQLAMPQATIETLCVAYTRELRRSAAMGR
jgi:hypothetical protein